MKLTTLTILLFLLSRAPLCFSEEIVRVGASEIHLTYPAKKIAAPEASQLRWIKKAAHALENFYGKYPVKEVWISIVNQNGINQSGRGIGGTTWNGRKIELRLGDGVDDERLNDDWTATHEMFHLAFPEMKDEYNWMSEGMATYFEPIARERVGDLEAGGVWSDMMDGISKGLPAADDEGLDVTHTWGRTYWGGCLFWFRADVEIREKTKNKKSVDDAMKAILRAGGDGSVFWSLDKVLEIGDRGTGLHVLKDLHDEMGKTTKGLNARDLTKLWKRLGISRDANGKITYDDSAPAAFVRKAIMK